MDIAEVMAILPHRFPFLMVDRLLSVEPGVRAVGLKNVSVNEPQFMGHYPGHPIFPGVLLLEAMAQVAGAAYLSQQELTGRVPVFAGVDKARFRRPVFPGDQVVVEAELGRSRSGIQQAHGVAKVEGKLVAEADLMFASMAGETKEREK